MAASHGEDLPTGSILGTSVRRVEDPDLLTGRGTFIANLQLEDLAHLVFVRSTIAHGRIIGVDTTEARQMPGVTAIYTAADLGLGPSNGFIRLNKLCDRPPLAFDKVRFVGDIVAAVVADTVARAQDAAEAVIVDYAPEAAVTNPELALLDGAPQLFEGLAGNLAAGEREGDDVDVLGGADLVVRVRLENQKVAATPMEGNAICAIASADDAITVYVSTQLPHMFAMFAAPLLELDRDKVRVITPHVGGAFGGKAGVIPEYLLAMVCSRRLGRPVKWIESRAENLTNMHGRSQIQYVEMGFSRSGLITGLRCRMIGDGGAYGGFGGNLAVGPTRTMAQGPYNIPAVAYDVAVAVTNTASVSGFRGAGRPEATCMLERLMDLGAAELDIDPAELRRRNLLPPESFPYTTVTGAVYDTGEYAETLDVALAEAGYEELRFEQARRRADGDVRQLGIGVCTYVEITGGVRGSEYASVEVHGDGSATIKVGTSGHGQGHPTAFGMIVADRLGIPLEKIRFIQSDTAVVIRGGGTGGSRSLQIGGSSILAAAGAVLDRARALAADLLEAHPDDIVITDDGRLGVAGSPVSAIEWSVLAAAAEAEGRPLAEEADLVQDGATFPFGAHVSVVEVDTETGSVTPLRHIAVDDCGRVVNPMIVQGQQHGGIAQGMAQALLEAVAFDNDGNPLTSTLVDYLMPSATDVCSFEAHNTETPTHVNPLGAKGIGESGTIGAIPAVHSAVLDALRHLGVFHIDMPCTPERVWRAISSAASGTSPELWAEPLFDFSSLPARARAKATEDTVL